MDGMRLYVTQWMPRYKVMTIHMSQTALHSGKRAYTLQAEESTEIGNLSSLQNRGSWIRNCNVHFWEVICYAIASETFSIIIIIIWQAISVVIHF